ncbi:MAG: septal ring lytic transglycosylase RlpA family protein [Acidobacteriota bacterium]|nr:septal ring lytic transglycosylase RlpA family protein [Acidobacteriota bacterium]
MILRARLAGDGRVALAAAGVLVCLLAAGCGHKQVAQLPPQAAPPPLHPGNDTGRVRPALPNYPTEANREPATTTTTTASRGRIDITPIPDGGISEGDLEYVETHDPIYSFDGAATWYRSPYKGRRAANGEVFDNNALTAANRTLPMGTLIRVTNLKTGQSAAMRVNDRGPFVPDKNIDLSIASAKAVGIYYSGTAPVRIDVYRAPKPLGTGGRWCVQIGAFTSRGKAERLKAKLKDEYPDARVIEFSGERSYWVRIRPPGDDRQQAISIAQRLRPEEGEAYLTRLD